MDHKAYVLAISRLVKPKVGVALRKKYVDISDLGEAKAPFNNFLNDDFLSLLYFSKVDHLMTVNPQIAEVKAALGRITDSGLRRHEHADAALAIGRFVRDSGENREFAIPSVNRSRSDLWFQRARELGSVVGAWELANDLLVRGSRLVTFDKEAGPLPIVQHSDRRLRKQRGLDSVNPKVSEAWLLGAATALRHMQRRFNGWTEQEFKCAIECIVNYLAVPPSSQLVGRLTPALTRIHALAWITPLWKTLIEVAPEVVVATHHADEYRAGLVSQQLAVLAYLRSGNMDAALENCHTDALRDPSKKASEQIGRDHRCNLGFAEGVNLTGPGAGLVIIKSTIPPTPDKEYQISLERYESLRAELPFVKVPDVGRLDNIGRTLKEEFPWATEVTATVMNNLYARRAHGAIRLGMTPVLLVGFPGMGKTRYAHRLSELLGTPNTVINLAGMSDVKVLKGCSRGWATAHPSRIVEFVQQHGIANPLFILEEIDKLGDGGGNSGDPHAALLDLLEPRNASRYQDIFVLAECDLSHCMYIATANSLKSIPKPLLSRMHPVLFPRPAPEHSDVIAGAVLRDFEIAWGLPAGTLELASSELQTLRGLAPREMRQRIQALLGHSVARASH